MTAAVCRPRPRPLQWLVLAAFLGLLYLDVLPAWLRDLRDDPNYSHGLLIPFVSLFFIRERWAALRQHPRTPDFSGLALVVFGLGLLLVGTIGAEYFTKRVSLIVVLFGSILFLEGRGTAKTWAMPVFLLFFAVPLPYVLYNAVAFPLKFVATDISVFLLGLFGMPVFKEGNIIALPHTTLEVVDACSGIRSLMTLFTLAFLLGVFQHKRWWKRAFVLLAALPVAILANAARVTATGILTKYDPAWGRGALHEATGWLVFVLSFFLLGGASALLRGGKGGR